MKIIKNKPIKPNPSNYDKSNNNANNPNKNIIYDFSDSPDLNESNTLIKHQFKKPRKPQPITRRSSIILSSNINDNDNETEDVDIIDKMKQIMLIITTTDFQQL